MYEWIILLKIGRKSSLTDSLDPNIERINLIHWMLQHRIEYRWFLVYWKPNKYFTFTSGGVAWHYFRKCFTKTTFGLLSISCVVSLQSLDLRLNSWYIFSVKKAFLYGINNVERFPRVHKKMKNGNISKIYHWIFFFLCDY